VNRLSQENRLSHLARIRDFQIIKNDCAIRVFQIIKNDKEKNKYGDWPEAITLEGCFPKISWLRLPPFRHSTRLAFDSWCWTLRRKMQSVWRFPNFCIYEAFSEGTGYFAVYQQLAYVFYDYFIFTVFSF